MKKIKFRQWTGQKWHYWGWLEDNIFIGPHYDSRHGYPESFICSEYFDKNGKQIYEGDILKISCWDDEEITYSKIYYNDGGLLIDFAMDESDMILYGWGLDHIKARSGDVEISGNIIENPELLEHCKWK
jgi:YopX protein